MPFLQQLQRLIFQRFVILYGVAPFAKLTKGGVISLEAVTNRLVTCINMAASQVTIGIYYIGVEREMRFFSDTAEGSRWPQKLSGWS